MAEGGTNHLKGNTIEEFMDQNFDMVIPLCGHAQETCPYFPSNARVVMSDSMILPGWQKITEEEETMVCYRKVRDEIRKFVESLPGGVEE
jgi:arsenate reductase (thioredoxin)